MASLALIELPLLNRSTSAIRPYKSCFPCHCLIAYWGFSFRLSTSECSVNRDRIFLDRFRARYDSTIEESSEFVEFNYGVFIEEQGSLGQSDDDFLWGIQWGSYCEEAVWPSAELLRTTMWRECFCKAPCTPIPSLTVWALRAPRRYSCWRRGLKEPGLQYERRRGRVAMPSILRL